MRKKLSRGDKFAKFREFTFANRPLLSFFAGINFRDLAATEKLNDIVFLAEKKYQRRKKNGN